MTPPLFYPIRLAATEGPFAASGASIPGVPFVVFGHNRRIAWGAVINQFDLTDVYQERIVADSDSPSGFSIVHRGRNEPVVAIPEMFRVKDPSGNLSEATSGVPAATLVVPRRLGGPIVALDRNAGTAISVQHVGFGATREVDGFRLLNLAGNLKEFERALRFIDTTGQNFVYPDIEGRTAFFSSGEVPLREDLEAGRIEGAPPFFIRDGTGGNEWIRNQGKRSAQDDQAIPFAIIPFEELPRIVDPPAGFVVTANNDLLGITLDNDPLDQRREGGGILYLSPRFNIGIRAQRITDLLRAETAEGCVDVRDMKRIQADVVLLDARLFTPFILRAFANARASSAVPALAACAADPRVAEAAGQLKRWDRSTPTGIPEGFDAVDDARRLKRPTPAAVEASVAATLYAAWRSQMLRNTIDETVNELGVPEPVTVALYVTALCELLVNFDRNRGKGRSGVDFFELERIQNRCIGAGSGSTAGLAPEARRDIFILSSLAQALERLAGPAFAYAFARSPNQEDYRWCRLHRVVLPHPLGDRFSINAADEAFQPFGEALPGAPVDGGYETVDAASHSPRATAPADFVFDDGPIHRYVAELGRGPGRIEADYSLSGGVSGVPGSPFFADLFRRWLTNDYVPLR